LDNLSDAQKAEGAKELNFLFNKLAAKSDNLPPAVKFLQNAIDTGDKIKILRAFTDIYSRTWKMSEVVPALKSFLNNQDPFVRYLAAQDLFIVGDNSGYSTLLALVQASDPIPGIEGALDVRIQAAQILAQYGQTDATQAIYNLYQQTKNGSLIPALEALNPSDAAAIVQSRGFFAEAPSMIHYGQDGVTQFVPQITSTFNSTQNPAVKAAAAWALATMTGDQNAVNYLVQTAQADLNDPSQTGSVNERTVISYLGSIQTPAAKQTLEAALNSSDPIVVQTAVVNLIYNQGGSDQAVQVIANQLNNPTQATLPWDFTLNMATQLLSNPTIQSAGQVFSQTDATGQWQLYTVERQSWPVSNWIGGYVVKLNK
jgi:HEAT repeat protein